MIRVSAALLVLAVLIFGALEALEGPGEPWPSAAAQTTPPTPGNVLLGNRQPTSLFIHFDRVRLGIDEAIYQVQFKRSDQGDDDWAAPVQSFGPYPDNNDRSRISVASLDSGVEYDLRVRACDGGNCSPWSAKVKGTTTTTAPGAPRNLTAVGGERISRSNTEVRVGWDAPQSDGGSAITSYQYQSSVTEQFATDAGNDVSDSANRQHLHTQLRTDTAYWFRIRAVNANGNGGWSTPIKVSRPPAAPTVSAPSGSAIQQNQLTFSWTAPTDADTPLTGFEYEWKLTSDNDWSDTTSVTASATGAMISGLTANTQYDFRVRALTEHRTSAWSATQSATTAGVVAITSPTSGSVAESAGAVNVTVRIQFNTTPAGELGLVTDLVGLTLGGTTATRGDDFTAIQYVTQSGGKFALNEANCGAAAWAANACERTITVTVVQDALDEMDERLNITAGLITQIGGNDALDPDATWRAVLTITDDDESAGQVTGLTATGGPGQATLAWNAPPSAGTLDGSPAMLSYQYRTATNSGGLTGATWVDIPGTTTSYTVGSLAADTHWFQVRALNGVTDEGDASTLASATVTMSTTPEIVLNRTSLTVAEGGSGTVDVKLSQQPSANVTVSISAASGISANRDSLSFTTSSWNTAQTVTVTAAQNQIDAPDASSSVTFVASGGDAEGKSASLPVTITDDDTRGITVNADSPFTIANENGGTRTYTVRLDSEPTGTVTITPVSGDANIATVSGARTFTTSNWNQAQTVTVTGVNDDVDNAGGKRSTTITHTVAGGDYGSVSAASVGVDVTDDDPAPTVTLAVEHNPVTEGSSATVTASLNHASDAATTITVSATAGTAESGDFTLSSNKVLTIAAGQTASTGTVTIDANNDSDSAVETVTVSATATNSQGVTAPQAVTLTINDDDTPGFTVTTPASLVLEGQSAGRDAFTVVLNTQPSGNVVINVSSDNAAVTVTDSVLTFTTDNWNDAQTVNVVAVDDDNAANETVEIRFAISQAETQDSAYDSVAAQTLNVATSDDDDAEIELSTSTLSVNEGSTNSYTVKLTAQPTSNVRVSVTSGNTDAATVNKATLTFSSGNWSSAQTVTVTGVHDNDIDDPPAVTITHSVVDAQSADEFDGASDQTLTVDVTDDDTVLPTPTFSLAAGDREIEVSGYNVANASSYLIAWDCGGTTGMQTDTASPYTITGLTNGTECSVTVQARGTGSNLDSAVSTAKTATPLSDNNRLSALTVSEGTLSPGFNANTLAYNVGVNFGVSSITVTPTAADGGATVAVTVGGNVQTGAISLSQGPNKSRLRSPPRWATTATTRSRSPAPPTSRRRSARARPRRARSTRTSGRANTSARRSRRRIATAGRSPTTWAGPTRARSASTGPAVRSRPSRV